MAYLILVRHGQTEWNALGLWVGLIDVELSQEGRKEARRVARMLKDIPLHIGYTSKLKRAKDTLEEIKKVLNIAHIPTTAHEALNEKNYGILPVIIRFVVYENHTAIKAYILHFH